MTATAAAAAAATTAGKRGLPEATAAAATDSVEGADRGWQGMS